MLPHSAFCTLTSAFNIHRFSFPPARLGRRNSGVYT